MAIDCDGKGTAECNADTDPAYQSDTSLHNQNDEPLTASVTPYVVIPTDFSFPGLQVGAVVAVIWQGRMQYGVFGDTGPANIIGEASYATAANLGINPDPATGGAGSGVIYIAFVGDGSVPSDVENQGETGHLGDQLASQLIANNP
jgi:hypothetical protein